MSRKTKLKTKILGLGLATVAPFSLLAGVAMTSSLTSGDTSPSSSSGWSKVDDTLISSGSFDIKSGNSQEGNTLASSWTAVDYDINSIGMIINVGTPSFGNNMNRYFLEENPYKQNENADNYILMINSKTSDKSNSLAPAKRGYKSNDFTLKANSYYRLSVDVKTTVKGWDKLTNAYASVYLDGLKNEKDEDIELSYTSITGDWATYNFFVATGDDDQNVNLKLYLGASDTEGSLGAVFFDEVKVEQYSQNAFIADCVNNRGYEFKDNYNLKFDEDTTPIYNKFLISALEPAGSALMEDTTLGYSKYNLDFEADRKSGLSENWFIPDELNTEFGHALVVDVTDPAGFKAETRGYECVGNDFSYDMKNKKENSQALALFTDKGKSTTITVEQKEAFEIKAHGVYKISMKFKTTELNGSFYVKLIENEKIYDLYNIDKKDLKTGEQKSTGFSSNSTNEATNNYTDVTFYVKGRALYDSFIRLQLMLGDETTAASGCVVVDNIKIEYASSADTSSADNLFELENAITSPSGDTDFKNAYFNDAEVSTSEFAYPLSATNWTLTQPENKSDKVVGGVILLQDDASFEKEYSKYDWGQINSYPGHPLPDAGNVPNNVFMLHNGEESYQSVKSESITLGADKYYNLTFDYYTLSYDLAKKANPVVEIIDDDGITLFKDALTNQGVWSKKSGSPVSINFHTAKTTSHKISVIIHLGEKDSPVRGTVYLDNFEVSESSSTVFGNSENKVDLTDYMLNLDPEGKIGASLTDSPAYVFDGDSNAMASGIVSGKENDFRDKDNQPIVYENNNLLVLATRNSPSSGSLKSKYSFSLSSGYYKLTFSLRTSLVERADADHAHDEDNHKCSYGVKLGFTNFELAEIMGEDLIPNKEFVDYTIYFNVTSDVTSNLQFTLDVDKHFEGAAFLTNINFESSSPEAFTNASAPENTDYKKTVFTSNQVDAPEEDPNPDDGNNDSGEFNSQNWILIPSIITALAVIIAIVGWILRHFKIKKIEKVREESYDRKISLNKDEILRQATQERDEEIAKIKANIAALQEQKQLLEDDHKQMIKDARLDNKGKITKDTEREFKSYANKLSRIQQKLDILNEQLAKTGSPEYLVAIERRVASDETKRQKDLLKQKDNNKKD